MPRLWREMITIGKALRSSLPLDITWGAATAVATDAVIARIEELQWGNERSSRRCSLAIYPIRCSS
jgi:hypothetical protein